MLTERGPLAASLPRWADRRRLIGLLWGFSTPSYRRSGELRWLPPVGLLLINALACSSTLSGKEQWFVIIRGLSGGVILRLLSKITLVRNTRPGPKIIVRHFYHRHLITTFI